MAVISEQSYVANGSQREFQVAGKILSDSHIGVWLIDYSTNPAVETRVPTADYDVLGSFVLFDTAPTDGLTVSLILTDNGEGIDTPPSELTDVSSNIEALVNINENMNDLLNVNSNMEDINTLALRSDIIDNINTDILPNIAEILLADDNASTATTKANEASISATNAQLIAWEAEAEKMTADSYATEPEDVFVKIYTSNGNGTFSYTNSTDYSALHWSLKTEDLSQLNDISVDTIQFNGGTGTQGTVSWNADEETLDIIQNGATLQVGQEVQVHCRNNTGVDIADGTVVMVTGTLGASGRITIAPYDNTTDIKYVLGVTTETIPNGEDGKVTKFGKIRGIDTSSWNDGDVLYTSTAGGLTNVEPTNGVKMPIAFVIYSSANGTLMVRCSNVDENAYQPYDANTAKTDTVQTFTASQRGTITTDNDGSLDLNVTNNFSVTPTGTFALTFSNIASGQSGQILLDNSGGHIITADTNTKVDANFLSTVSTAGVYILGYFSSGTSVYVYNSGAMV